MSAPATSATVVCKRRSSPRLASLTAIKKWWCDGQNHWATRCMNPTFKEISQTLFGDDYTTVIGTRTVWQCTQCEQVSLASRFFLPCTECGGHRYYAGWDRQAYCTECRHAAKNADGEVYTFATRPDYQLTHADAANILTRRYYRC